MLNRKQLTQSIKKRKCSVERWEKLQVSGWQQTKWKRSHAL